MSGQGTDALRRPKQRGGAKTKAEPQELNPKAEPSGYLNTEVGPKPKLNPRSCVNKEEKGKFLPASSGAVD